MKYLDPKADLTFKKVFGEHPDLVISLLNALLPFETPEEEVVSVEYLPSEMVPESPLRKNSIVDVRCKDGRGRQFIVEMQMIWSQEFKSRVLFNASKAYVRQLDKGYDYELLQPVYSLNLVNEVFEPDIPKYYHYYRLVHKEYTDKVIDGLHLVFVELPKFTPHNYGEKKMQVLWLRYLTEISEQTRQAPQELLDNPEVHKALSELEESAFTDAELEGYDQFWDAVSVERTLINSATRKYKEGMEKGMEKGKAEGIAEGMKKGKAEGIAEGMEKGMEKGIAEGMKKGMEKGKAEGIAEGMEKGQDQERLKNARAMKAAGFAPGLISQITGLALETIEAL